MRTDGSGWRGAGAVGRSQCRGTAELTQCSLEVRAGRGGGQAGPRSPLLPPAVALSRPECAGWPCAALAPVQPRSLARVHLAACESQTGGA